MSDTFAVAHVCEFKNVQTAFKTTCSETEVPEQV